jgi:hypothetical protein
MPSESVVKVRTLDGLHLAGTLASPDQPGDHAVVLVHGGGRHPGGRRLLHPPGRGPRPGRGGVAPLRPARALVIETIAEWITASL